MPEPDLFANYTLQIRLGDHCRRNLKVSPEHTLEEVADAILSAFAFDDTDHLYHFQYQTYFGASRVIAHLAVDYCDGSTDATQLHHLHPVIGMKMNIVFDYGDNWEFGISVIDAGDEPVANIEVISQEGEAPEQYPDDEEY